MGNDTPSPQNEENDENDENEENDEENGENDENDKDNKNPRREQRFVVLVADRQKPLFPVKEIYPFLLYFYVCM